MHMSNGIVEYRVAWEGMDGDKERLMGYLWKKVEYVDEVKVEIS